MLLEMDYFAMQISFQLFLYLSKGCMVSDLTLGFWDGQIPYIYIYI